MENSPFTQDTLDFLQKAIGGLETLKDKKVITSSIVAHVADEDPDALHIIKKIPGVPNPEEDWVMFMLLRAYCGSVINTGKTLRAEKDIFSSAPPDFCGRKDIEQYFYYGNKAPPVPEDPERRPPKPYLVMTKKTTLDDIKSIPFYKCKSFHHIVEKTPELEMHVKNDTEIQKFGKEYNVSLLEDEIKELPDAIDYLINKKNYGSVLVEAGPSLLEKYLVDPNTESLFDLIVLSVYRGKTEKEWIGHFFPSLKQLSVKYNIIHTSPAFPCNGGNLTIYCLGRKVAQILRRV